ncbi:MAG: DUF3108 domain-containing protein [Bacteroidetes bacterium]|jgi:hypothetical protein|nr:DUF3108 domain-containing protein [Bacteroidota bacterium]
MMKGVNQVKPRGSLSILWLMLQWVLMIPFVLTALPLPSQALVLDPPPSNQPLRAVFSAGEHLRYRLHYGFVDAGVGELKVMDEPVVLGGQPCYHIVATGSTTRSFDWIYKVRDRYESYVTLGGMVPLLFKRDIYEGGFAYRDSYSFDQTTRRATSDGKQYVVPDQVQDIVSAFYAARSLDYSKAVIGQIFELPLFLDHETHRFIFRFKGRKTVSTDVGTFRALVFMPVVMKGRVFSSQDDLVVYISDDDNKIPLQIKANILVGSVKMTLTEHKGLRYPLSSKITR